MLTCGFKRYAVCNLPPACLVVMGLVRDCVSCATSLSSSAALPTCWLPFTENFPSQFFTVASGCFSTLWACECVRVSPSGAGALCSQEGAPLLCEGHQTHSWLCHWPRLPSGTAPTVPVCVHTHTHQTACCVAAKVCLRHVYVCAIIAWCTFTAFAAVGHWPFLCQMNLNEFFFFFPFPPFVSLGPIEFEECNAAIATEGESESESKRTKNANTF